MGKKDEGRRGLVSPHIWTLEGNWPTENQRLTHQKILAYSMSSEGRAFLGHSGVCVTWINSKVVCPWGVTQMEAWEPAWEPTKVRNKLGRLAQVAYGACSTDSKGLYHHERQGEWPKFLAKTSSLAHSDQRPHQQGPQPQLQSSTHWEASLVPVVNLPRSQQTNNFTTGTNKDPKRL